MSVRASGLPADVRHRLGLPASGRTKPRPSRAGVGDASPCPGHCASPKGRGAPYPSYTRWQRHRDLQGCHGRWSIDLDNDTKPGSAS